jgi:hypothetical protein
MLLSLGVACAPPRTFQTIRQKADTLKTELARAKRKEVGALRIVNLERDLTVIGNLIVKQDVD